MQELLVYRNADKEFKIKIADKGEQPFTYQVVPKFDADANIGFQKHRTTKPIDPSITNKTPLAFFDVDKGIWDTALTANSKALSRVYKDDEDLKRALQFITKEITNPLIKIKGANSIDVSNNEFWDEFAVDLTLDKSFNTSDPLQLFYLYSLIIHGKLAPTDLESEPYFKVNAQFSIENKDTVVDAGQKREFIKNKAVARFMTLLDADQEALKSILEWMGIVGLADANDELMNQVFVNWLTKDDNQNPKEFLETYANYYETESGKSILSVFKGLKDLERKKIVKRGVGTILMQDEVIGKNMKEAAQNLTKELELLERFYALLDKAE